MARLLPFLLLFSLSACIGDDIVEDFVQPELRLDNLVDTIEVSSTHQFAVNYFNDIGVLQTVSPSWTSDAPEIISIDDSGLATAHTAGSAMITASYAENGLETTATHLVYGGEQTVEVEEETRLSGTIRTTSSYVLTGDFILTAQDNGINLAFGEDYVADEGLPGLYVYLTNNPSTTANALEIGPVEIFRGAHEYAISGVELDDYLYVLYFCKPFNVKVGDGEIN